MKKTRRISKKMRKENLLRRIPKLVSFALIIIILAQVQMVMAQEKNTNIKIIESIVKIEPDTFENSEIEIESTNTLSTEGITMGVAAVAQEDIELIANLMFHEEGVYLNRPEAEKILKFAGSVVIHRVNMKHKGVNTIQEAIYKQGQYASVEKFGTEEIPAIVYTWAEDLLINGPIGPENLIFQSEFKQGSEVYWQYGNQYFCLE